MNGTGAWYEGYRSIFDSEKVLEETMILIKPLGDMITTRNIAVFWIGLVPMTEHDLLADKDAQYRTLDGLVRKHLERVGVHVIDEKV